MSVEIWPPISPEQLKIEEDATQARELIWLLDSLQTTLLSLKHGLEECYALLAPIDPGSTLVLSTPRAELVKGHVTRVGARIVKGTIYTKLRTMTPLTISIDPAHPIHLAPLVTLNTLLTQAIDLASLCLTEGERKSQNDYPAAAAFLSSQLRLLAQGIDEASAILKGPPVNLSEFRPVTPASTSRPGTAVTDASIATTAIAGNGVNGTDWTEHSAASSSFAPQLARTLSFHVIIQDACLVLYLRALEPADAPVNLGIKLALAIGTTRRLEHDEAEKVFAYRHHELDPLSSPSSHSYPLRGTREVGVAGGNNNKGGPSSSTAIDEVERVYVREKVRVESADPSLLSMTTKLSALSNVLGLARRNLAAVMGEDLED
ncbi:hypothetical protein GGR50DRAFT_698136 [Xylaria sp. CBS 124048]|nr:hypothetical protein GGR50DRAFT_698136 [Xylaria sp. CBS 124048]